MKRKGFTLIELLIVVAIIGILAAIAIPNFLMAQVRAKIARNMADFTTIGTALETYRIDKNKYPGQWGTYMPSYMNYPMLTTPMKYMNWSVLIDPFKSHFPTPMSQLYYATSSEYYKDIVPPNMVAYNTLMTRYGYWRLWGFGPDKLASWFSYDPTNGTVSDGDIIRSQKYGHTKQFRIP